MLLEILTSLNDFPEVILMQGGPLEAMIIASIISGGLELGKTVWSGIQAGKARKRFKGLLKDRPGYDVQMPEGFEDLMDLYKRQPPTRAPGSEIRERETEADLAEAAKRMQEVDDTRSILGGIQGLHERTLKEKREIGRTDLEYAERERERLEAGRERTGMFGTRIELGEAKDKWLVEQYYPWQFAIEEAGERGKAMTENVFKGLQGLTDTTSTWATNQALMQELQGMQGGGRRNKYTTMPGFMGS